MNKFTETECETVRNRVNLTLSPVRNLREKREKPCETVRSSGRLGVRNRVTPLKGGHAFSHLPTSHASPRKVGVEA